MKKSLGIIASATVLSLALAGCGHTGAPASKNTMKNKPSVVKQTAKDVKTRVSSFVSEPVQPDAQSIFKKDVTVYTNNGLYPILANGKYDFIDKKGNFVFESKYRATQPFNKYVTHINYFNDQGKPVENLMNSKGELLFDSIYTEVTQLDDGGNYYTAANKDETILFDIHGKLLLKMKSDERIVPLTMSDDTFVFSKAIPNNPYQFKFGIMNAKGDVILPPTYDFVGKYSEGYAVATKQHNENSITTYIIDKGGNVVKTINELSLSIFTEGLAVVSPMNMDLDPIGYMDTHGEMKITNVNHYSGLGIFQDGLALFSPGDSEKKGFIDKNGNVVVKPIYVNANTFHNGLAVVQLGDHTGVIDTKGKVVVDFKYTNIEDFDEFGVAQGTIDGQMVYLDKSGKELFRCDSFYNDGGTEAE